MKKLLAVCLCLVALPSCVSDPVFRAYVAADRQNYNLDSLMLRQYIENDQLMQLADKNTHFRRIESEDLRIREAERLLQLPGVGQ